MNLVLSRNRHSPWFSRVLQPEFLFPKTKWIRR